MAQSKPVSLGNRIKFKGAAYVRLPRGTTLTAQNGYTPMHAGVHVVIQGEGKNRKETRHLVVDPKADAETEDD